MMLGISMGGCVSLRFALLYPECVSSLVLVNTFAKIETKNYRDAYKLAVRKYLMPLFSMERLASMSAERLFGRDTDFYELAYRKFLENERSCYLRSSRATFRFDCLAELKNLKIPTLIIAGRNDRVVSARHALRLHKGIKSSVLVFLGGGHALPLENPSEFNNTVLHFLEG
jgi:pimeloyl-ACP methyl ester carboxylesterase